MRAAIFLTLAALMAAPRASSAFYTNIVVDGSFDDWAGVPVVATDAEGDGEYGPDLATLQVANDDSNLFLRITYFAEVNPNTSPDVRLAVDNDHDAATGFDIYGLGLVGSEAGWQNDFPFQQSNGWYNSGAITGGGALIAPYNSMTTQQEYAIRLDAVFAVDGEPVFPNSSFALLVYTDPTGVNETMGPVTYTLSQRVEAASFDRVTLTNVLAFRITESKPQASYVLESATTPGPTNWVFTGYRAQGNGGDLLMYDPTGFSTVKLYRVTAEY